MKSNNNSILNIFDRLNDLKDVFKLGEKVVPIIQSLTEFMKEIIPLVDKINASIVDSTNRIPEAQNQIHDVTSAHELATTEILDRVDVISNRVVEMENSINDIFEKHNEGQKLLDRLAGLLNDNEEAKKILDQYTKNNNLSSELGKVVDQIKKVNEDAYNITLSLQVQDITAQQLSAVNHLINNVNTRLTKLMTEIDNSDLRSEIINVSVEENIEVVTFDKDARYIKDDDRQKSVDSIIDDQKQKASQEEIDKLFS